MEGIDSSDQGCDMKKVSKHLGLLIDGRSDYFISKKMIGRNSPQLHSIEMKQTKKRCKDKNY
jgi:hypothetical protein